MNNSLERILEGLIATLRQEIIPDLSSDFARSQAIAAIDVLNNLKPRVDWLATPLAEEVAAQAALLSRLDALFAGSPLAPPAAPQTAPGPTARSTEAVRDRLDRHLCAVTDWLSEFRDALDPVLLQAARTALAEHRAGEVRRQLGLTPKPLFSESSHGKSVEQSDKKSRL